MFFFIYRNWFPNIQVAHRTSFLPSELTRGIFWKLDKVNFEAFKVFHYFFKHHGWIPGWILTCLDPKNLSVGQKQPFQAPPLQSLNTLMLQIIVELNFGAFKVFQDFFKHQGWTAGGILTYLDPKVLTQK